MFSKDAFSSADLLFNTKEVINISIPIIIWNDINKMKNTTKPHYSIQLHECMNRRLDFVQNMEHSMKSSR